MKIFVLHKAGKGTELRQIAAEKIDLVHHAQDPPDLSFAAQDAREYFAGRFPGSKLARHVAQAARQDIG